ncbi:MAG: hypothetical protein ACUVS5_14345, partial [Anaerolineae bacterium]
MQRRPEGRQPEHAPGPPSATKRGALAQVCLGFSVAALAALEPLVASGGAGVLPAALVGPLVFLPAALAYGQLARQNPQAWSSFQLGRAGG